MGGWVLRTRGWLTRPPRLTSPCLLATLSHTQSHMSPCRCLLQLYLHAVSSREAAHTVAALLQSMLEDGGHGGDAANNNPRLLRRLVLQRCQKSFDLQALPPGEHQQRRDGQHSPAWLLLMHQPHSRCHAS